MTAQKLNDLLRPFHQDAAAKAQFGNVIPDYADQLKAQAELNAAVTSWMAPKYCEQYAEDEKVPDDDDGSDEWGTITHPRRGGDDQ